MSSDHSGAAHRAGMIGNRLLLFLFAMLLAGSGGVYFLWWPRKPVVPVIATNGLDAEVIAAIEGASAEVETHPKSAAAWGQLGMVLFAQNMYADSIGILAEAERLDPSDAHWPYFRGLALILPQPEEGIVALERAVKLAPDSQAARLRLAEEYLKLQRLDEAEALFRELLVERPDNPRALLGRGQILSRRGKWQEALVPLKTAADYPTARRSARIALAETYARLGDTVAAREESNRVAEVGADDEWPDTFLARAIPLRTGLQPRIDRTLTLLQKRRLDAAADLIKQVLDDHPNSDEAHLTLGKVLMHGGALTKAEEALRQAILLNPRLEEGHFLLAGTLMNQKRIVDAEHSLRRVIELNAMHGLAHYNLGICRLGQGDKAGAIVAFRDAVRCRPDLVPAYLELSELLLQEGKVVEASSFLEKASRLDNTNERVRSLLEQALAKKKRAEAGRSSVEAAVAAG